MTMMIKDDGDDDANRHDHDGCYHVFLLFLGGECLACFEAEA